MQYLGGKHRQGRRIGAFVNEYRGLGQTYWEPFVGAMGVLRWIRPGIGPVFASDVCGPLIELLRAVQAGWVPPIEDVDEQTYLQARTGEFDGKLTAFYGFGCSYGGKWFGGLARDKAGNAGRGGKARHFAARASQSLVDRMAAAPPEVSFARANYLQGFPALPTGHPAFVYCDPPYATRTQFYWAKKSGFDTDVKRE